MEFVGMRKNMSFEEKMNLKKNEDYSYFCNQKCEYFPCHNLEELEEFNCLFCFCPLYTLGRECGGDYVYSQDGKKDCSNCSYPHKRENYLKIVKRLKEMRK